MGITIENFSNQKKTLPSINFRIPKGELAEINIPYTTYKFFLECIIRNIKSFSGKILFDTTQYDALDFLHHNSFFLLNNAIPLIQNKTLNEIFGLIYKTHRSDAYQHIDNMIAKYLKIENIFNIEINKIDQEKIPFLNVFFIIHTRAKIYFLDKRVFQNCTDLELSIIDTIIETKMSHGCGFLLLNTH